MPQDTRQLVLRTAIASVIGFVSLIGCSDSREVGQPQRVMLLRPVADSAAIVDAVRGADRAVIRRQFVTIDTAAFDRTRGVQLQVPVFSDTLLLQRDSLTREGGSIIWTGRVADQPTSSVILSYQGGALYGTIHTRGDTLYEIHSTAGGGHVLQQRLGSSFPPDEPPGASNAKPRSPGGEEQDADDLTCETDPAETVDVFVVYTSTVRAKLGGPSGVKTLIDAAVRRSNEVYANSGVTLRIRQVGSVEENYAESANLQTDRDRLTLLADGKMDGVHALRDTKGADIVALIVESGNGCGIAYIMHPVSASFADRGFAVVVRNCAVANLTFPHELGHIMGARHDRKVDPTDGQPYDFNHGYIRPKPTSTAVLPWRTVMAYDSGCVAVGVTCRRVPYFSNPGIPFPGAGGDPMGTVRDDNHRTLNATAKSVANFRCRKT